MVHYLVIDYSANADRDGGELMSRRGQESRAALSPLGGGRVADHAQWQRASLSLRIPGREIKSLVEGVREHWSPGENTVSTWWRVSQEFLQGSMKCWTMVQCLLVESLWSLQVLFLFKDEAPWLDSSPLTHAHCVCQVQPHLSNHAKKQRFSTISWSFFKICQILIAYGSFFFFFTAVRLEAGVIWR